LFPLSWLKRSSLWQKEIYFERKRFQNSSKGLPFFSKESNFSFPFQTETISKAICKTIWRPTSFQKGVAKWIFKVKSFVSTLPSTKCFQTKDPLAQFVLKSFDFTLRAKSFSK
jgi:hypothetical protein